MAATTLGPYYRAPLRVLVSFFGVGNVPLALRGGLGICGYGCNVRLFANPVAGRRKSEPRCSRPGSFFARPRRSRPAWAALGPRQDSKARCWQAPDRLGQLPPIL